MDEVQAAVLRVKLAHLDEDNAARKRIAARYLEGIRNPLISMPELLPVQSNVWHQFPVFCERRDELQQHLADKGIQTLIHYPIPPHKQECYSEWGGLSFPVTERIHERELSLPISPVLSDRELETVISGVNSFC